MLFFTDRTARAAKDEKGKPLKDKEGKTIYEEEQRSRPIAPAGEGHEPGVVDISAIHHPTPCPPRIASGGRPLDIAGLSVGDVSGVGQVAVVVQQQM